MGNDSKKLLTLGNVEAIKDYIDVSSNNIKYYVDEEFKNVVNTRIQEATTAVNNSFIAKTTEITNKINLLEQTTGNKNEINELKLQLDAVKADNDAMNTALEALNAELEAGLNDVSGSIMSAGQINDLVSTALINSVNISSDAVEAPTVYTQNLVALIGKFGQIKATNIVGSEISGKTVKSTSGSWELNNNGAGKLANGNITWNESGNVTFGPNVKLNWGNIEGSDDATNGVEAAMSVATAAAAAAATAQASANEATALANEAKNSIPTDEDIEDKITTEISKYEVKAEQLTGKTITGATIKSSGDNWELTSTGAGKLANGNITWTEDGVVTFSDNVELKWGNITGAPTIPEGSGGLSETEVNNLIATQITNSGITANTIEGKTIKSTDDKWELNSDGSGYLGNFDGVNAIEWDTNGVKIQGEKVEISGDVKINGQAIITGITSNTSAQESFNDMVADCINATEIKTDVLETKPDGTDKVHIEDNYIHCITSAGNKSLIISSNDVDPGELDTLFNPNAIINDKMPTDILFDATTTYQGATYACNGSLWRSGDGIQDKELTVNYGYDNNNEPINIKTSGSKLGYIYKSGSITANISLTLHEGNSVEFNPMNPKQVLLKDWNIAQGAPITDGWGVNNNGTIIYPATSPVLPTTYIVGGGDSSGGVTYPSTVIGRILIYRSDANNGIYYKYRDMTISGIDKGWTNTGVGQARTLTINNIEIWDPGYYAVELCFNPNSFILLTSTTATNKNYCMHGGITTTIAQDAPADYMKIGKNGLVAFNSSTGFSIDDNNITMRARNNNNFYGIKIAPSGIYIGDGNTTWKRLDMTKLFSLLASAE